MSATQILKDLRDKSISSRTIQRRLVEVGQPGKRQVKNPVFQKSIKKLRGIGTGL